MAKLLPLLVIAYALSPLDLIPDFIPVLGLLDDLLLLPSLIWLAVHLIPHQVSSCTGMHALIPHLDQGGAWLHWTRQVYPDRPGHLMCMLPPAVVAA